MRNYPVVLSITGSDCIGKSGAQADLKTISALNAYGAMAVTALIGKNSAGLKFLYPIPQEVIKFQIETAIESILPDVVNLGLLSDVSTIRLVGNCLRKYHLPYVIYHPALLAWEGIRQMLKENTDIIRRELLPFVSLVILTCPEAELICKMPISTVEDMQSAAKWFVRKNNIPLLIKGDDLYTNELYDVLRTPADEEWVLKCENLPYSNAQSTRYTFSATIATCIGQGHNVPEAIVKAREFLSAGKFEPKR